MPPPRRMVTTGEPKTSGSARIYTGETPAALFPGEREEPCGLCESERPAALCHGAMEQ